MNERVLTVRRIEVTPCQHRIAGEHKEPPAGLLPDQRDRLDKPKLQVLSRDRVNEGVVVVRRHADALRRGYRLGNPEAAVGRNVRRLSVDGQLYAGQRFAGLAGDPGGEPIGESHRAKQEGDAKYAGSHE